MRVHIIGPNLLDQSKGSFHVHAEGCADVRRNREYQLPEFASDRANAVEVASQLDAAEYVYSDQIGDDEMTAADGVNDLWFAPCTAELPYEAPTREWVASVTIVVEATSEADALEQAQVYPAENPLNWQVEPEGEKVQFALVTGSPIDGLQVIGPFDDVEAATRHAEQTQRDNWWVTLLADPNHY